MNCTLDSYHNCLISVKKPCRCKSISMLMQKWFHHIVPPYSLHLKMYQAVSIKHPCGLLTQFQIFFDFKMAISVGLILIWVHYYKHWMYFWICIVCIRFLLSKITLQKDCLNPMEQARNLHSTVSSLMNCGNFSINVYKCDPKSNRVRYCETI